MVRPNFYFFRKQTWLLTEGLYEQSLNVLSPRNGTLRPPSRNVVTLLSVP
jgi:hypothetical protein